MGSTRKHLPAAAASETMFKCCRTCTACFLHVKGNSMTHKGVQVVVFAIRAKPLGAKCDFAALGFMVQMEI